MKKLVLLLSLVFPMLTALSQDCDSVALRKFFNEAILSSKSYNDLQYLCTRIGGRLCGSPQAAEAVRWSRNVLENMKPDTVFLQECKVRHWVRGTGESVIVNRGKKDALTLHAAAIGGSVGTGKDGISGSVIEVCDFDELKRLGKEKIVGKIVFFNHPADPTFYYTFNAYGGVVRYRVYGATEAAIYGAIAVIVRSATLAHDNYPHTGIMHYADSVIKIPAMTIGTNDADSLSWKLKNNPDLTLFLRATGSEEPETASFNVIAEIRGSEHPEEVIVVGGHLDSWDIGKGANDDGAGAVQSMEVLRLFRALGIKPKRTIRVVLFMDEEMEQRGAKAYAEFEKNRIGERGKGSENPIAAIEADRGGATPFGFSIDGSDEKVEMIRKWKDLLLPYGLYLFEKGGSGVDIRDLKPLGTTLIALVTDSQRYFDYHHSPNDTFDKINQRELQLGSFSMAALVFLLDKYGL